MVDTLLEYGSIDPSLGNNDLLNMAIVGGRTNLVDRLLLDPRVLKVLYQDDSPNNPFIKAVIHGRIEVIRMFLKDTNINPGIQDNMAIKVAAEKGKYSIFKLLIADNRVNPVVNNSKINPGTYENDPIKCAAGGGHYNIVNLLLTLSKVDRRINPCVDSNYPFRIACNNGHFEVVKLLLTDHRVNPGDAQSGAIVYAIRKGQTSIVKLLLKDKRVNPATTDNTPIKEASACGHVEILKLLLQDPRIDPATDNNRAIQLAAKYWKNKSVKILIKDSRVDPQIGLYGIIKVYAFHWGDVVEKVINHPKVNFGRDNNKALHLAVKYGNTKVLKLLLFSEKGKKTVNPTIRSHRPEILFTAIDPENHNVNYKNHCQKPIIRMLLQHPAIKEGLLNGTVGNPFVYAIRIDNLPIAKMLWKEYPVVRNITILQLNNMIKDNKDKIWLYLLTLKAHLLKRKYKKIPLK
jgi:ankyrin repeat protein